MPYRGADAHLFTPLPVDELPLPAGLDPDRLRAGGFALVPAEALWADAWHSLGGPAGQGPPADVDFSSEMLLFVAVADGAATPVEAAQGPDYVHVVFAPPSGQEGATLRLYRLPRTSSAVRVSPRRN